MTHHGDTSAFHDVDVLVVVDDWKGSAGKFSRLPTYYSGRSFRLSDPETTRLYETLHSAGAANWHASGDRATHSFLFDAPVFDQILRFLNTGPTCLYDMLASVDAFETPVIQAKWRGILEQYPELQAAWDVRTPYAMSLFRFTDFLAHRLSADLAHGTRVRIVVDRLDWTKSRRASLPSAEGVVTLGWNAADIHVELTSIADKSAIGALPYLPLLGLVDSEVWAFGRFNSLELADGRTIHERFLNWQATGSPGEVCVVSDDDIAQAMSVHDRHHEIRAYWEAWLQWRGTRSITLHEKRPQGGAV